MKYLVARIFHCKNYFTDYTAIFRVPTGLQHLNTKLDCCVWVLKACPSSNFVCLGSGSMERQHSCSRPLLLVSLGRGSQVALGRVTTQTGLSPARGRCVSVKLLRLGLCLIHCSWCVAASPWALHIQTPNYGWLPSLTSAHPQGGA